MDKKTTKLLANGQVIIQYFILLAAVASLMFFGSTLLTKSRQALEKSFDQAVDVVVSVPANSQANP